MDMIITSNYKEIITGAEARALATFGPHRVNVVPISVVDVTDEISDHLKKELDIEKMNACMENLGEPCKTLLKDFYVYKLSMDEISEKFGYTNSDNAKTQKYKCLQRLKRYFFEDK